MRAIVVLLILGGCAAAPRGAPAPRETVAGPLPRSWVEPRLAEARQRLAEDEGGRLIWAAIDAHGGLDRWLASGTVSFDFDYRSLGQPPRRLHTHNKIDLWRARAFQRELGEGARVELGWDGKRAWITPGAAAFPSPARFWALTPYYFVGVPFVLADPGARFERLPDAPLGGVMYRLVKVTYEPGTGDSPDDYYIIYLHPETHQVGGLRYVVAYPGFFPKGGHTPEKLMLYEDPQVVDGLTFAHRYDTYAWNAETGTPGDKVTEIVAGNIALGQTWPASIFSPPRGAEVSTTIEPPQAAAPPALRLPRDVVPSKQAIALRLDPAEEGYRGSVVVELDVARPVTRFRFHAEEMKIDALTLLRGAEPVAVTHAPGPRNTVEVTAKEALSPGPHTLRVEFSRPYDKRAVGLYQMTFEGRPYLFTQLEAVDARKAFPCWDEPSFKISYQLTVTIPEKFTAVSNTPIAKESAASGWKTLEFAPTKPLPSYLLALAVGEFDVKPISGMHLPSRIFTPRGQSKLTGLAEKEVPLILAAVEKYFDSPHPFEKLDLIAIPEYWPGAMENPGAITFADAVLLLDEKTAAPDRRAFLTVAIAHELAHQWFGNLVTMQWWDDLWLNESFAQWLGHKIAAQLHPEFELELRTLEHLQGAMANDSRPGAKTVHDPSVEPENALGNVIQVYHKGEAVLRMFEEWIGPEVFRQGVLDYLKARAWKNAVSNDLWMALGRRSNADVAGAMVTFTEQPGFPLIEVERLAGNQLRLKQQRFTSQGVTLAPQLWKLPVRLKYFDGQQARVETIFLDQAEKTVELPGKSIGWIHPKADGIGYYRWALPAAELLALGRDAGDHLTPAERIDHLGNLSALFAAGRVPGDTYLAALERSGADPEPAVISMVVASIGRLQDPFGSGELEQPFEDYVRRVLSPALKRLGREPRKGEKHSARQVRAEVSWWLGAEAGDREVVASATKKARAAVRDPKDAGEASALVALRIAAAHGDAALFEAYKKRFEAAQTPSERGAFLEALASFRAPEVRAQVLEYALSPPVRANEVLSLVVQLAEAPENREAVQVWVVKNLDRIVKRVPPLFLPFFPRFFEGCSEQALADARALFAKREYAVPGIEGELERLAGKVQDCVALRRREGAAVAAYLGGER